MSEPISAATDETSDRAGGERLDAHRDARGLVVEPLPSTAIAAQANVHLATLQPGAIRGNHLHERGTEVLTVIGPALVRTRAPGEHPARDVHVPADEVYRFTFAPGEAHAIRNTGDRPTVVVAFSTEPHDPARPDVVRSVLLEG